MRAVAWCRRRNDGPPRGRAEDTASFGPVCLLPVAAGALWAAVPAPDGPPPTTWPGRLSAARTTLLVAGAVLGR